MWLCDYELFSSTSALCLCDSYMNIHQIDSYNELNDASFNLIIMLDKIKINHYYYFFKFKLIFVWSFQIFLKVS